LDSDGLQDFGEPGIGNVTIQLFDSNNVLTATTTTDANGFYSFNDLAPGDYNVTFLLPTGYSFTHDNVGADDARDSDADLVTGSTAVTTLTAGENDLTWDAGLYQQLHLGNRVWEDLNDNGLLDNGEVGIGNVLVELQDAAGNPVLDPVTGLAITTVTDSDGYYLFTNLPNGAYIVHIPASNFDEWTDPLYGFVSSQNQVGPEPATDPDDDVDLDDDGRNHEDPRMAGISSLPVTLAAGSEPLNEPEEGLDDADGNLTVDFGFFELLTLGNHVWFDTNNNGLMENNEPGVPAGVTLHLLDGNSNPVTHPVTGQPIITTTDNNGFYQFTNLYPGDYRVLIAPENFQVGGLLEGFESSDGSVDHDDDVDVDDNGLDNADPANNGIISQAVTLNYDTEPDNFDDTDDNDNTNLSVDFGIVQEPTAVTLSSFSAVQLSGHDVEVRWTTESEVDNFGFNLYRSATISFSGATQIHFEPTAVPGGSGPGTNYSYVDTVPQDGTWYYWLVDVDTSGNTDLHGPVSVDVSPIYKSFIPFVVSP
jgi:protocatechuate 3,4-dioxygenase beta subunit